tara:strand:- start:696 stop:911 length:216 start_codon:yes stop_codon:yes gene_type:complete
MTHHYDQVVDGIIFRGEYTIEEEEGYNPIFTVDSIRVNTLDVDLLLVIDPRVVQEIEHSLVQQWLWNEERV